MARLRLVYQIFAKIQNSWLLLFVKVCGEQVANTLICPMCLGRIHYQIMFGAVTKNICIQFFLYYALFTTVLIHIMWIHLRWGPRLLLTKLKKLSREKKSLLILQHKFGCSTAASQQKMALYIFWINCKRSAFLSSFSLLQVIQNKRPLVLGCGICDSWMAPI